MKWKLIWKWKPTWSKSSNSDGHDEDEDGHDDGGPVDGGDGDQEVQCDGQDRRQGQHGSQDQPGGQGTDPMGDTVLAGGGR